MKLNSYKPILFACLIACSDSSVQTVNSSDFCISGGPIYTADDASPTANAVAVKDGVISYVGSDCLLYTSPSPRDGLLSRMPSSA